MKIQSLSVVVPNAQCINNCSFCVSKMHTDNFKNQMDDNLPFFDLYLTDYLKRLEFARDNGCNTIMLTGNSEPQQNRKFLTYFGMMMKLMQNPSRWIEMQTTGVLLDKNYLRFLRNHVGVNLISLSVSSFDDGKNASIIGMKETVAHKWSLHNLCQNIKEYDFSLRLSLNLNKFFEESYEPEELFRICKNVYNADQVTLRILYSSGNDTPQDKWINENGASKEYITQLKKYIKENGVILGQLPYGQTKYSIMGMSVVLDDDCMAKQTREKIENYKYLVLQPNCKLYSSWDDAASLIF